jgi:hypothetical protein
MIDHCDRLGDRFAILDREPVSAMFGAQGVESQRPALDSARRFRGPSTTRG